MPSTISHTDAFWHYGANERSNEPSATAILGVRFLPINPALKERPVHLAGWLLGFQ